MNENINDAQHPFRKSAIEIIRMIINEWIGREIAGEEYYELEDRIVEIISRNCR